jgi:hypothetical protein
MEESNIPTSGQFQIRVRKGDWEVEISAPDKEFVLSESSRLIDAFSLLSPSRIEGASYPPLVTATVTPAENVKPETLSEFFRQYQLQTHLEKMLVLGYWLEIKQGQSGFTTEDILARYKEVREKEPANPRRDLNSLASKGLMMVTSKPSDTVVIYALTNSGIKEVETKLPRI